MKRKKTEETPEPAKFWPVPGVDGEPYPPLVQEALDLVAKETKRLKIRECSHEDRYPTTGFSAFYGIHAEDYHVCACRACGADRISCLPSRECDPEIREARQRMGLRTPVYGFPYERQDPPRQTGTDWLKTAEEERRERRTDRHVSRQIQRVTEKLDRDLQALQPYAKGALASSTEMFVLQNANGEAVLVVPADDRAPDLSWVRTMNGRKTL